MASIQSTLSTRSTRARAALVVGLTALLVPGMAGPAAAMTGSGVGSSYDDGEQRGTPMSLGQVVLVFVVVPLGIIGLVWLLVKAPGWTRSGRPDAGDVWAGDPLDIGGPQRPALEAGAGAAVGADATADAAASDETGGTSARW